jgi:N-acetylglucosaminyldiphosphoundecaprenol N-acetyl-beta-D-mannosaminyltransferase
MSFTHFLYGATEEMLAQLKANLEERFPGVQIVGTYAPPFRPLNEAEEEELRDIVAACKPDFFWVGLSTPKQEKFMAGHSPAAKGGPVDRCSLIVDKGNPATRQPDNPSTDSGAKRYPLDAGIMLGVGAAFPIHAGLQKDAPEWIKNSGLQWLHRLCQEPKRLWRRYLDIVPTFLWLAALQLLGIRKYSLEE